MDETAIPHGITKNFHGRQLKNFNGASFVIYPRPDSVRCRVGSFGERRNTWVPKVFLHLPRALPGRRHNWSLFSYQGAQGSRAFTRAFSLLFFFFPQRHGLPTKDEIPAIHFWRSCPMYNV